MSIVGSLLLLNLLVFFSNGVIYPLYRQKERIYDEYYRYAPYTLNMSFYSESHGERNFTVALDTYSKYFIFYCCSRIKPNGTVCLNVTNCYKYGCEPEHDGYCQHQYSFYPTFVADIEDDEIDDIDTYKAKVEKVEDIPVSNFKIENDEYGIIDYVEVVQTFEKLIKEVDGIMGIAYSFLESSFNKLFYDVYDEGQRLIGIDIFPYDTAEGRLILGKRDTLKYVEDNYPNDTISWSEMDYSVSRKTIDEYYDQDFLTNPMINNRMSSSNTIRHMFPIYDLEVCGADLFGFLGGYWHVILNTNIEGIALPFEFYKTVETYINFDLFEKKNYTLPSLTFFLESKKKFAKRKKFTLPLDLLYSPKYVEVTVDGNDTRSKSTKEAFHLSHRGKLNTFFEIFNEGTPYIHFGTRVIQHFMTILDMDQNRVGLIEKEYVKYNNWTTFNSTTNVTTYHDNVVDKVSCLEKEVCSEYQWLDEASNECANPQCELYIFQRSDDEGRCVVRLEFVVLMLIIILMFAMVDYTLLEGYNCYAFVFKKFFKRNPIVG